ncbi:hypothetical protein CEXT_328151 [Caerostris extrusa]|uniref:Uncharacterized protein n=1 Tax=Caerostris extrusa TaxID=172846 RepID=A0AAV4XH89_CAEEX|nr:hypothetical protein CEXT_328151 [Caerostris extrusa]
MEKEVNILDQPPTSLLSSQPPWVVPSVTVCMQASFIFCKSPELGDFFGRRRCILGQWVFERRIFTVTFSKLRQVPHFANSPLHVELEISSADANH